MSMAATEGVISKDVTYEKNRALQITGWGESSWRKNRMEGLRVFYLNRKCYVEGAELIRFIRENGKTER